ncbi:MAG TPA: RNA polymerase sigma factor [Gemmatimonadaceae bacterium]|nr:RNA polymerase sigma factor [Gemmatimonadaceae bacterium]
MSAPTSGLAARTVTVDGVAPSADVVRRAQQGDVGAFESLYRTHAPAIHALARRMVGDEREAREVVQDIFVRAWERLASFRGESTLGTWLHRLAVNVVLERLRSARRDAGRFTDDDVTTAPISGPTSDARLDARMDIDAALARLPAGARTVFVLHDIEGYSHEEIATITGLAPGTARAQLWRARRRLMRLLDA